MLVFNEGVPRSGKSYDTVKNHILPALKKGRHVWARLNGIEEPEKRQRIADYLQLPRERIEELLHHVVTKDVVAIFQCFRDQETGEWRIADHFKNALIVVDEVHEFYVNERKPLDPAVEAFWALLGQNGGDAVILTQWLNRTHSAVKARIEKKHSFQKLSAVGMEGKYLQTYYQTVAAGKFEKIGSETKAYDPEIFPLYRGYADGATNVEVYKEGGTNVWKAMAAKGVIYGIVAIVGLVGLLGFFLSGGEGLFEGEKAQQQAQHAKPVRHDEPVASYSLDGRYLGIEGGPAVPLPPPDPLADLSAEQRYVAELASKGRIRLAARVEISGREWGAVEWVDQAGNVQEFLDVDALRALGFEATFHKYGLRLSAGDHVLVATPWPRTVVVREPEQRLYSLSPKGGGAGAIASAASESDGAAATPPGYTTISGDPAGVVGAGIRVQ